MFEPHECSTMTNKRCSSHCHYGVLLDANRAHTHQVVVVPVSAPLLLRSIFLRLRVCIGTLSLWMIAHLPAKIVIVKLLSNRFIRMVSNQPSLKGFNSLYGFQTTISLKALAFGLLEIIEMIIIPQPGHQKSQAVGYVIPRRYFAENPSTIDRPTPDQLNI